LSPPDLEQLFQRTLSIHLPLPPAHIAVACSGGSDSLALTLLAHRWAMQRNVGVTALIVDHGLRMTSAIEAARTAKWLEAASIASHIITLALTPGSATQERARHARYHAMAEWCQDHEVPILLLGHHAGDQAETVLLRLLRGSGLAGLAGMAAKREMEGTTLLRPLLHADKSDMEHYLRTLGQDWVRDPSNENDAFLRTQLRNLLSSHASVNPVERLNGVAQALGHYRHAQEIHFNQLIHHYISNYYTASLFMRGNLMKLAPDNRIALLSRALTAVDGGVESPRHADLLRLDAVLPDQRTHSLHRCLIIPHRMDETTGWVICREPAAVDRTQRLVSDSRQRWDRRFLIDCCELPDAVSIGPLGEANWQQLRDKVAAHPLRQVACCMPALRHLDLVIAVPHIGYVADGGFPNLPAIRYLPAKPLAEVPFCAMI
jgi:tRNA(Ile)-lysidine synthase